MAGRGIDPAPKGAALADLPPAAEALPKRSVIRSPVIWIAVAGGIGSGVTTILKRLPPMGQLAISAGLTAVIVAVVVWERRDQRRRRR